MAQKRKGRTAYDTAIPGPTHDVIERRARDIYVAQGSQPGRDLENWLTAERELLEEKRQRKP